MSKEHFMAWTVAASDVKKAAKGRGWNPKSDVSPSDLIEPESYSKGKLVASFDEGVQYCVEFIKSGKSWWGCEYVIRDEWLPGDEGIYRWVERDDWTVTHDGVETHRTYDEYGEEID